MSFLCRPPAFVQGNSADKCPILDPGAIQDDMLSVIVSLHSRISDHVETGDEEL